MQTSHSNDPLVSFYRVVPGVEPPMRADRSALGALPTAAYQYCEAVAAASAFGWYVFPPFDFHVMWDGTDLTWSCDSGSTWSPVTNEHYPGLPELFDASAPEDLAGYAPPFLSRIMKGIVPGILQIWTGYLVRTRRDHGLLIRAPVNLPRSHGYECYEGIIETDSWFYPLFTNVRIIATERPIFFEAGKPLLQVQPLHRALYAERATEAFVDGLEAFTVRDWADYRRAVVERSKLGLRPGRYAASVRKRAKSRVP
jgi:hypothetical protein